MANFAVNCPDEVISRGNALIAKMAEGTDEKKAETLNRMFAIVEKSMDDVIMQENGIDTKGLDAALNDIRRMFQTASSNRERLLDEKEQQIIKLKMEKASLKNTFQNQLQAAMEEKEVAMQSAKKAEEDALMAKKQADTAESLAAEKEKFNTILMTRWKEAKEKLAGYNDLKASEQAAKEKIADLQRELEQTKKDHASELSTQQKDDAIALTHAVAEKEQEMQEKYNELEAYNKEQNEKLLDLQREIDQLKKEHIFEIASQQKDAAIALERAVAEKEREMQGKIQSAELETARISGKIELLEARIRELMVKDRDVSIRGKKNELGL